MSEGRDAMRCLYHIYMDFTIGKKKTLIVSHSVFISFDAADGPVAAEMRAFSISASLSARKDASTW